MGERKERRCVIGTTIRKLTMKQSVCLNTFSICFVQYRCRPAFSLRSMRVNSLSMLKLIRLMTMAPHIDHLAQAGRATIEKRIRERLIESAREEKCAVLHMTRVLVSHMENTMTTTATLFERVKVSVVRRGIAGLCGAKEKAE